MATLVASAPHAPLVDLKAIEHEYRAYQEYPGANYVLPADNLEAKRLSSQHEVLKRAYEGRVLFVPHDANTGYFVLDSGTGAASWLLEVSKELSPSAILHGIDIERRSLPLDMPPNISYSLNTATNLPAAWTDKFDIVNQRLLFCALRRTEWMDAVAHIHRILRPGGWVQLGEVTSWTAGPHTERHRELVQALFNSLDLVMDVSDYIPQLLADCGFKNISVEKRTISVGKWAGVEGEEARDIFTSGFRGMKTPILRSGGYGFVKSEQDFDAFMDDLETEWDVTKGAHMTFIVFIAQK